MIKTNLLFRKSEAGFPKRKQSRRKRLILSKKKQSPKKKADFDKKKQSPKKKADFDKKSFLSEKKTKKCFSKEKNQIRYLLHKDLIIIENIIIR